MRIKQHDYAKTLEFLPKQLKIELNRLWDIHHNNYFPDCIYHHPISETTYNVLDKWFNVYYYPEENLKVYGRAWQINDFFDCLQKIENFCYAEFKKTHNLTRTTIFINLFKQNNADYVIHKILSRLVKAKKINLITEKESLKYFNIIEEYKVTHFNYGIGHVDFVYEYQFFNVINDICNIKLRRKNENSTK